MDRCQSKSLWKSVQYPQIHAFLALFVSLTSVLPFILNTNHPVLLLSVSLQAHAHHMACTGMFFSRPVQFASLFHSRFYSSGQEDLSWPQNPILWIHSYQNFPLLFSNTFFPWYTSLWNQSYYLIIMCGLSSLHLEYTFHECWDFCFFHISIPSIWINSWHILGIQ